jgi:hypothetical protein
MAASAKSAPFELREALAELSTAVGDTASYFRALWYFLRGGAWCACPVFNGDSLEERHAKVQTYSLSLILYLWDKPHYRKGTYQQDLLDNLRNVAIPGTGVPLSFLARFRFLAYLFLFVVNPVACVVAACRVVRFSPYRAKEGLEAYRGMLLRPLDWCSLWRLNCRLAGLQALRLMELDKRAGGEGKTAGGFRMEDKWTFLDEGAKLSVPVTPVLDLDAKAVVIKDVNEEGGMGVHFFTNAAKGGRFIIQEAISNGEWLTQNILPPDAPLSTLRVMSASRSGLKADPTQVDDIELDFEVLSCCLRAGRAGASTDHKNAAFNCDVRTGELLYAKQNQHWYRIGLFKGLLTGPWQDDAPLRTEHPDVPDRTIGACGVRIPDWENIKKTVQTAHSRMMPDVPLVGWDVALTDKGIMLLEVNLSCNFFLASFDVDDYVRLVGDYFHLLDGERRNGKLPSA